MNAISKPILPIRTAQAIQTLAIFFTATVAADAPDLTARQSAILLRAHVTREPMSVRAYAADMGTSRPAVTRAIDRLEELDLVERVAIPKDQRLVGVRLTHAGVARVEAMAAALRGAML